MLLIFGILVLICFATCKKDETNLSYKAFSYPVEIGNYWKYDRLLRNVGLDTSYNIPDSNLSKTHIEVTGMRILYDTLNTYGFIEYYTSPNFTTIKKTLFTNEKDGFYYHAYTGGGTSFPIKNQGKIKLNNLSFNNAY